MRFLRKKARLGIPSAAACLWGLALSAAHGLTLQDLGGSRGAPLFKTLAQTATADDPVTLEVYVLYVQFQDEESGGRDDNSATTGRGVFGSDKNLDYTLDPNGEALRTSRWYLEKHFDFANNYYDKVSGGRVRIVPRLFPRPDGEGRIKPLQLSKRMAAYNPDIEDKEKKQKIRDFEEERGMALMSFVHETVDLADALEDEDNPFLAAEAAAAADTAGPVHRAFMIFHAGHSRLVDGGNLGYLGADSKNDFIDFFVTKPDWSYLENATVDGKLGGREAPELRAAKEGFALSTGDTLTEVMMLSESASQEKLNWGINGILVNQLGRQMGMPDLFDVVRGISQVGGFDVMDFAGYNSLNGFLPVFPSAWVRSFMGWDEPVRVVPGAGKATEVRLFAADQPAPGRVRSARIDITSQEYLLVENRQRAAGDSNLTVYFDRQDGSGDLRFSVRDSVTVPFAFIDSLFIDTVCATWNPDRAGKCDEKVPNPNKPKGIITGASHYDAGLPGNGLLVWHVNEWFLDEFLRIGAVNLYLGDTLGAQYKGLELVEADGIPSIGKIFKDFSGQDAFDYGTAADFLPHIYRTRKDPPKDTSWGARDTLTALGAYGYANTSSWNDARTHVRLEVPLPEDLLLGKGMSANGDSIYTVRDSALTLRVVWADNESVRHPEDSRWPVSIAPASLPTAVSLLRDGVGGGPYLVALSDSGATQGFSTLGEPLTAARDTLRGDAGFDSVNVLLSTGNRKADNDRPLFSLADPLGPPLGSCAAGDSGLAVLVSGGLRLLRLDADSLGTSALGAASVISWNFSAAAGPLYLNGRVFAAGTDGWLRASAPDGSNRDSLRLHEGGEPVQALTGWVRDVAPRLAAARRGGAAVFVDFESRSVRAAALSWGSAAPASGERLFAASSDFDRDGIVDLALLGSRGVAALVKAEGESAGQLLPGWPQRYPRSLTFGSGDSAYRSDEPVGPALADLDGDGYPDLLFTVANGVAAVDRHGAPLPGWPYNLERSQAVGFLYGSREHPETAVRSVPVVAQLRGQPVVLIGSPDGWVDAVDANGKRLTVSSLQDEAREGLRVATAFNPDWPLAVGGPTLDTTRSPVVQPLVAQLDEGDLELVAVGAQGVVNAWTLRQSALAPGRSWPMPGGDAGRTAHLDASVLDEPSGTGDRETIESFRLFPSPLRGGVATLHLKLGAPASAAQVRVFDLSGHEVKRQSFASLVPGLQPFSHRVDLRHLAPDVYTVQIEVDFPGGKKRKWQRLGVVR